MRMLRSLSITDGVAPSSAANICLRSLSITDGVPPSVLGHIVRYGLYSRDQEEEKETRDQTEPNTSKHYVASSKYD